MSDAPNEIHVMLVDDSSVIRRTLTRILTSVPHIKVVKSVADGTVAVAAANSSQPDIVLLDIEMPVMDGLTALPRILEVSEKSKIIMFSSLTEKGATVTMEALRLGAVECILKPSSAQEVGEGSPFQKQLISLIENLVPENQRHPADPNQNAEKTKAVRTASAPTDSYKLHDDKASYKGKPKIVAIGGSTGGPPALFNILKHCKNFDAPIVITQHMPATFTKILAEHIEQQTGVKTQEGQDGMLVEAGQIYVAPGGFHMLFETINGALTIKLDEGPLVNFCKPSVDPMLNSIVDIYGRKVLGVILTGMGNDGCTASKRLVAEKGRVIAQDKATSVVWGMPGAVAQANICSAVLPIDDIGPWIKTAVTG